MPTHNPVGGRSNILLAVAKTELLGAAGLRPSAYRIYRPATGEHDLSAANLAQRYSRVDDLQTAQAMWVSEYEHSAVQCLHQQPCRYGPHCEAGKRVRHVHILSGVLLSVWGMVTQVLATHGTSKSTPKVIRVVETQGADGGPPTQVLGILLPNNVVDAVKRKLMVAGGGMPSMG